MITKYETGIDTLQQAIRYGVQMMVAHGTKNFKYSGGLPKNDYGSTFTTNDKENELYGVSRHGITEVIPNSDIFSRFDKITSVPRLCFGLSEVIYMVLHTNNFNPMTHIVNTMWVEVSETEIRVHYTTSEWSPPTPHEFLNMTRMRQ